MGDPDTLRELAAAAVCDPAVTRHSGIARFESLQAWLHTEIRGWTLADTIDDHGFATLLDAANDRLSDLVEGSKVVFDVSARIISGSTASADQ